MHAETQREDRRLDHPQRSPSPTRSIEVFAGNSRFHVGSGGQCSIQLSYASRLILPLFFWAEVSVLWLPIPSDFATGYRIGYSSCLNPDPRVPTGYRSSYHGTRSRAGSAQDREKCRSTGSLESKPRPRCSRVSRQVGSIASTTQQGCLQLEAGKGNFNCLPTARRLSRPSCRDSLPTRNTSSVPRCPCSVLVLRRPVAFGAWKRTQPKARSRLQRRKESCGP